MAIAEAVKRCRPNVISAYPITPQTHIVEDLAQMVADGELKAEFVNVESEFSAASVCLGASATGARAYTATTSQGLLLMAEVLFNIGGLRLPIVLTCANRAVSSPLSIWNDHQDAMTVRDSGWIQLWAEDNQEAADMHFQAFKIAERVSLPVMVNMDGFVLTHAFEPVDMPEQEEIDAFLPPFQPKYRLDPANPLTFGYLAEPDKYMEARYILHRALDNALPVIADVAAEFKRKFGRGTDPFVEGYTLEDAEVVLVGMGSMMGTVKDAIDEMREEGTKVGALRLRTFRPFPKDAVRNALRNARSVAVMERAISLGNGGILSNELKEALYGAKTMPNIGSFIVGLGGRDVTTDTVRKVAKDAANMAHCTEFVDLRMELIAEGDR